MKVLSYLSLVLLLVSSAACTRYVILFKPPAEMDPIPKSSVEREAQEGDAEQTSWSLAKIGMDEKYLKESTKPRGNKNVRVAILSTGIDYNHEDLIGQFVVNKSEITEAVDILPSVNYKDDDGNGKVDDIVGLDVVDGDGLAFDRHGAGTAVAGIIAAKANGYGVRGMLDEVDLYPVRYINENGQSDIPKLVQALNGALEANPDVVFVQSADLPFGGGQWVDPAVSAAETTMLQMVLAKYTKTDIPIVVAAGESLQDVLKTSLGSTLANVKNVIYVTSVDKEGKLGLLANYGQRAVEIAAPGEKILTCGLNNQYKEVRGTAFAAAHVAGAIALAKSIHGENLKLEDHILPALSSARANTPSDYITWNTVSGAILNVPKFLEFIDNKIN